MNEKCGNCKFFHDLRDEWSRDIGECRRSPPVVHVSDVSGNDTAFPAVTSDEWCGEWKPRESQDTEDN